MTDKSEKGYYIGGVGVNVGGGRVSVGVEYGIPADPKTPWIDFRSSTTREKIFEIFRYDPDFHPDMAGSIFVIRHNPQITSSGRVTPAVELASTPELNNVFDYYLPQWELLHDRAEESIESGGKPKIVQVRVEGLEKILDEMPITLI